MIAAPADALDPSRVATVPAVQTTNATWWLRRFAADDVARESPSGSRDAAVPDSHTRRGDEAPETYLIQLPTEFLKVPQFYGFQPPESAVQRRYLRSLTGFMNTATLLASSP